MLKALNSKGENVLASIELENTRDFRCSHCNKKVILKKGTIKTPHFAHIEKCECSYNEYIKEKCGGESKLHYDWKLHIKNQMEQLDYIDRVELEVRIGNRIADVVVHLNNKDSRGCDKFIVEVQLSKINIDTIIRRSNEYIEHGYSNSSIFWLLGEKNASLASDSYIGLLDNNFKISRRHPVIKGSRWDTMDIVNKEEQYDIFKDNSLELTSIKEYKKKLDFDNKLKLCKKFIWELEDEELGIANLINTIKRGKKSRKRYNLAVEQLKEAQQRKSTASLHLRYLEKLNRKVWLAEQDLREVIVHYKEAQERYLEHYKIDSTKLDHLINMVTEFNSRHSLKERILKYEPKDFNSSKWYECNDVANQNEKREVKYVYKVAASIYEIEHIDICTHSN